MPAVNKATKYATKKAPPPLLAAMYGKRQTLPSPTAEATAANMKAVREFQCSLFLILSTSFI